DPGDYADIFWRELDAIRHDRLAVGVVRAGAAIPVEQLAAHVRRDQGAGIFILKLDQAAAAAAITERFPLGWRHLIERFFFPEGHVYSSGFIAVAGLRLPEGNGNHIPAIVLHLPCRTGQSAAIRAPGTGVQDPFYTKEKKRKRAGGMLAADAWLDSSLYEFWQALGRAYTRYQDFMSRFHVSGIRRFFVEILSDAFSFGAIGAVLMTALAMPAFDIIDRGVLNKAEDYAVVF